MIDQAKELLQFFQPYITPRYKTRFSSALSFCIDCSRLAQYVAKQDILQIYFQKKPVWKTDFVFSLRSSKYYSTIRFNHFGEEI